MRVVLDKEIVDNEDEVWISLQNSFVNLKKLNQNHQCISCHVINSYFGEFSLETTHVERPQNGANSHVFPASTVEHLVLAKHIPGKSGI